MKNRIDADKLAIIANQKFKEKEYWLGQLYGLTEKSNFPYDFNGENITDEYLKTPTSKSPDGLFSQLGKLSRNSDIKLHMILAAGLVVLLEKYRSTTDIVIGTPIYKQESESAFINTVLVLRNRHEDTFVFKEFLQQIRNTINNAVENQNYPIDHLVRHIDIPTRENEYPFFDVCILLQNIQSKKYLEGIQYHILFEFHRTDNCLELVVEYNPSFYRQQMVEQIIRHYIRVMEITLANVDIKLSDIDILSKEEKEQLLAGFNGREEEYPSNKTLPALFIEKASRMPDRTAVVGHGLTQTNTADNISITYRQLNEQSDRLAGVLSEKNVQADDIVGIILERSVEMIMGILAILKAGGAYLPIDPDYPQERIEYMLKDSGTKLLVTTNDKEGEELSVIRWEGEKVLLEKIPKSFCLLKGLHSYLLDSLNLAYIIYTSGSTGKPKGVAVTHQNVIAYLTAFEKEIQLNENDTVIQQAAYTFDAFVEEMYPVLVKGGKLAIPSRETIMDVRLLAEFIARHGVSLISCSPLLLDQLNNSDYHEFLRGIHTFISGGDVLQGWYINKLLNIGKVYNSYGPTESTVCITYYRCRKDSNAAIPIGKPIANYKVYIVDKALQLVPPGVPGELCVGGPGVTRGYLNKPELTAEKFIKNRSYESYRTYIFYKTGDRARWLPGGPPPEGGAAKGIIEFLGRMDSQVKVRGYRIELGEIENSLLENKDIKQAIVVEKGDSNSDKYLCGYIISDKTIEPDALRHFLGKRLPDYMIPWFYVQMERFPLTPNGKIDRKALPEPEAIREIPYVSPRDEMEEELVQMWSEVLSVDKEKIGIDTGFFDLGGNSLKAIVLITQIHKSFNVRVLLEDIFRIQTIRGIAEYIKESDKTQYLSIEKAEKKEYYALSSAQKRMYMLQQFDEKSTAYNIPQITSLEGNLDKENVAATFRRIIRHHESLRTSFADIKGEPVQIIAKEVVLEFEYHEITQETAGASVPGIINAFIRPFDLSRAPLMRTGLIKTGSQKHILMVDIHHIISDGVSQAILMEDFILLYTGAKLLDLEVCYKDFSEWQRGALEKGNIKKQGEYWLKRFDGEIPVLDIPADYPRPMIQSFEGRTIQFDIAENEMSALTELGAQEGLTPFMVMLSMYSVMLSRLSSRDDIIVGTPVAGRRHADLQKVIGMFVNTLALRNQVRGETVIKEFFHQVKETTLKAFENQDYPFEELVENSAVDRNPGRNPLFDVAFVMQNIEVKSQVNGPVNAELSGLELRPYEYENKTAKFDLTFFVVMGEYKAEFFVEYCSRLFKESTIKRFNEYLIRIIREVIKNPGKKIQDIEMIPETEKQQILYDFNNTATTYPWEKTIHELFKEQVEKSPDYIAVFSHGTGTATDFNTYRQLNEQSDQTAGLLIEKGVLLDDIVGIMIERSIDLIIGLIGILKVGAAYMPIDPEYPPERIQYMLEDSKAKILLGTADFKERIIINCQLLIVNCKLKNLRPMQATFHQSSIIFHHSNQQAYIIYTSGSTGKPKGVVVKHRNVVRLVKNTNFVPLSTETRILQTGAPVFDATTFEIWGSLLNGGQLVLTSKEIILDARQLAQALSQHRINTLWLSAPLFNRLLQQDINLFAPLEYLLVGGDVLSPSHINQVRKKFPGLKVINGYGPTENTTFSTTYLIEKEFTCPIPIGKPIANSTTYIIAREGHLQPIGVWGELYVGGDGVSLGYLNNVELTAEKFIKNRSYRSNKTYIFYKTGDLVRWLPDGIIEFKGRIDQQVKIRGLRIELGEIETQLLKHESVKETVVIDRKDSDDDEKYLCAYIVPVPGTVPDGTELKAFLSQHLPDYMVPAFFVVIEKIPLNLNGKVDKQKLPSPLAQQVAPEDVSYEAPWDYVESTLKEIWADVLNIECINFSIDDNFFERGGHSLNAAALLARMHKTFHVSVPLKEFYQRGSIRDMAKYIKEAANEEFVAIAPAEEKEYYPLSAPQKRLYILYQMDKDSNAYNMPVIIALEKNSEKTQLEKLFMTLIQRHESLRTSFITINGEAVQKIHKEVEFEIENVEIAASNTKDHEEGRGGPIWAHFIRPFDLAKAPLMRVGLLKQANQKHLLLVDMHHIISDGISHFILEREFLAQRRGQELPPPGLQYKDYVQWHYAGDRQEKLRQQEKYWLDEFSGELPTLNLPTDYPRPLERTFEGNTVFFSLSETEKRLLKELAREMESTLFIATLWIFFILLYRLSGNEDIVIGVPVSGRRHHDLDGILGVFINTLPIRLKIFDEQTAEELMETVKQKWLKAYDNQDYPFEELVAKVSQDRDTWKNPLFDVLLNFIQRRDSAGDLAGPTANNPHEHYIHHKGTSKFDLSADVLTSPGNLGFSFEYSTQLFKPETIEKFLGIFRLILSSVLNNPGIKLKEIQIEHGYTELKTNIFNDTLGDF